MEHIERAGIHSGDSACILPSAHISEENLKTIYDYTTRIAQKMHVVGLMNMQYAIENGKVFVLEANPRASRTVPLVSKVCGISMVPLAVQSIMANLTGKTSPVPALTKKVIPYCGVKQAVFPFNMFPEVDPVLGPEMRSTGEVLGIARTPGEAFFRSKEASPAQLPMKGAVLISLNAEDKPCAAALAKRFHEDGYDILATGETCDMIEAAGIPVTRVNKEHEGRPNASDYITNGKVQLIVNTPTWSNGVHEGRFLRKNAIRARVTYISTIAAAEAAEEGIRHMKEHGRGELFSLQEWHDLIGE